MSASTLLALEIARAQRLCARLLERGHVLTPAERTIANVELSAALAAIKRLALPMTREPARVTS